LKKVPRGRRESSAAPRFSGLNEALTTLQRAAALAPEDAAIHEHLGDVYLQSDPEQAKAAWQQALRLDPANAKLVAKFKTAGFGDPQVSE